MILARRPWSATKHKRGASNRYGRYRRDSRSEGEGNLTGDATWLGDESRQPVGWLKALKRDSS